MSQQHKCRGGPVKCRHTATAGSSGRTRGVNPPSAHRPAGGLPNAVRINANLDRCDCRDGGSTRLGSGQRHCATPDFLRWICAAFALAGCMPVHPDGARSTGIYVVRARVLRLQCRWGTNALQQSLLAPVKGCLGPSRRRTWLPLDPSRGFRACIVYFCSERPDSLTDTCRHAVLLPLPVWVIAPRISRSARWVGDNGPLRMKIPALPPSRGTSLRYSPALCHVVPASPLGTTDRSTLVASPNPLPPIHRSCLHLPLRRRNQPTFWASTVPISESSPRTSMSTSSRLRSTTSPVGVYPVKYDIPLLATPPVGGKKTDGHSFEHVGRDGALRLRLSTCPTMIPSRASVGAQGLPRMLREE